MNKDLASSDELNSANFLYVNFSFEYQTLGTPNLLVSSP